MCMPWHAQDAGLHPGTHARTRVAPAPPCAGWLAGGLTGLTGLVLSSALPPSRAHHTTRDDDACSNKQQHQGYGAALMAEAERIARMEHRSSKIAVISGVGTRHYYRCACARTACTAMPAACALQARVCSA